MRGQPRNVWVLVLFILAGVVLGGFIGSIFADVPALSWLSYGNTFGLSSPLVLDIGVLTLQFALTIRFTVAGIIGISIAILIYRKL
nr:DUF4321 domain-containing protein [Anaerotignum neopropionicum]